MVELPWRRRVLPGGIAVGQIAAALEAVTTARVSHRMTVRIKGRDVLALGDGVIDFARGIECSRICLDGWQVEHLDVGADRFCVLPAEMQQATGKLWVWEEGCPYGNYWRQVSAAVRHIAECTGSGAEILAGEPVQRYSFLIRPRRRSFRGWLLGKETDPFAGSLHAHLRAHGTDRLNLDIWLAGGQAVRKVRESQAGLELALFDGRTNVVTGTREYSDFGVTVDLAAPPAEAVLGGPMNGQAPSVGLPSPHYW